MNTKKIKKNLQSSYMTKLKSSIKTELEIVYITTNGKKFLNQYQAIIHQSELEDDKKKDRRWEQMKAELTELVCKILEEKQWGIFFKNEPMQALPVQDNTTLYKINEVKKEELVTAIDEAVEKNMTERVTEWRKHQTSQNQKYEESSSGTKMTSEDTKE